MPEESLGTATNELKDTSQHYITRAYLDKFIHPISTEAVLYPYRKGGNPCKARGTKKLGCYTNFYRQLENGELNDKLDEARKFSETLLFSSGKRTPSALAQCVFDENFVPTQSDRLHLAAAAAFLFCGSPVQIHNTAMHTLLLSQMEAFNSFGSEEVAKVYRERFGDQAEQKLKGDREQFLKGEVFMDVGRKNWKQLGFQSFQMEEGMIRLLLQMNLTIVECHYRSFFLTSDNPVIRKFPSSYDNLDDDVWFPISHKRGVLWHRRRLPIRTTFGHAESRSMNRRVIKLCYKFVYSPLSESWVETDCRQETHDPLYGHYGSLEKVIAQAKPAVDQHGRPSGEIVDLLAAMKSGERHDVLRI